MTSDRQESPSAVPDSKRSGLLAVLVRAALPIGILTAGGVAYSFLSVEVEKEKSPPVAEKALRTKVVEIQVIDYPVIVTTNGVVQPHNEVTLSAQVSGQISRVSSAFEAGSYFAEGDVLVELDDRDYATSLAVAKAQHLGAESALHLATQNHEQNAKLFEKNGVSEAALNLSSAAQAQAKAQLDAAVAQVEQAERDLQRTRILAPFAGRVRQRDVGLGQSVGVGSPLGVVFAVDFAEVRLPIAGGELRFLELPELADDPPLDVELRNAISGSSEDVWQGRIVRTEGVLDENSLELFAIARVDDPFGLQSGYPPLRIGQPVVGSIAGKVLTNVVALPRLAVRQLDQIFLVDKEELTLSAQTIVPIWSDKEHVIVRNPLIQDGGWLSTTNLVYAPNGAKVEIIPDIELTASTAKTKSTGQVEPVTN
jgi:RND family efflux transporter MFP subunit